MEEGAGGLTNWDEEFHFIPFQFAWSLKSQVPLVQPLIICQDQEDVSLYPCSQMQEVIKQSCSQLYLCHQFHRFPVPPIPKTSWNPQYGSICYFNLHCQPRFRLPWSGTSIITLQCVSCFQNDVIIVSSPIFESLCI